MGPRHSPKRSKSQLIRLWLKRYKFLIVLSLGFLFLLRYLMSDSCHGAWHTQLLCKEYEEGLIAGDLCHKLCVEKSVYMSTCSRDGHGNLVFPTNWTAAIKTRDRYLASGEGLSSFKHVYKVPETGTSIEQFRNSVTEYLNQRLGEGDHRTLVQHLFDIADSNKDDKVSLAEAKSLWSLLKHNEFLILHIFKENFHIPKLLDFCGEVYRVHHLPYYRGIYNKPGQGFFGFLFPSSYTWGFPVWHERGKIAVGLLELTLDVYQHHNHGAFYLCNLNETNIGYSPKSDAIIQDGSMVLPKKVLYSYLENISCKTNEECRYTDHCNTVCDLDKHVCSDELVHPNLALVCTILRPYLLPDIPKPIRADFLNIISNCENLSTVSNEYEVQHALILNDLKSLLWRRISALV